MSSMVQDSKSLIVKQVIAVFGSQLCACSQPPINIRTTGLIQLRFALTISVLTQSDWRAYMSPQGRSNNALTYIRSSAAHWGLKINLGVINHQAQLVTCTLKRPHNG
jgi:hypothetical protein